MKGLISLAAGLVAGYSISRAMEARACGIPLSAAFKLDPKILLTSVYKLKELGILVPTGQLVIDVAATPTPTGNA